jgi:hypothetical protein
MAALLAQRPTAPLPRGRGGAGRAAAGTDAADRDLLTAIDHETAEGHYTTADTGLYVAADAGRPVAGVRRTFVQAGLSEVQGQRALKRLVAAGSVQLVQARPAGRAGARPVAGVMRVATACRPSADGAGGTGDR